MYLLCFRMRSMMDDPQSKSLLAGLPLESILRTEISPLKVRTALKYNLKICTSTSCHVVSSWTISWRNCYIFLILLCSQPFILFHAI